MSVHNFVDKTSSILSQLNFSIIQYWAACLSADDAGGVAARAVLDKKSCHGDVIVCRDGQG